MRTTIDLPADLHELARELAHRSNRSMSQVIADLIRAGLQRPSESVTTSRRGMPRISVGRPITPGDIESLDDEE